MLFVIAEPRVVRFIGTQDTITSGFLHFKQRKEQKNKNSPQYQKNNTLWQQNTALAMDSNTKIKQNEYTFTTIQPQATLKYIHF